MMIGLGIGLDLASFSGDDGGAPLFWENWFVNWEDLNNNWETYF